MSLTKRKKGQQKEKLVVHHFFILFKDTICFLSFLHPSLEKLNLVLLQDILKEQANEKIRNSLCFNQGPCKAKG